jgi:pyridoxal phosphate enzyme (YggS family)
MELPSASTRSLILKELKPTQNLLAVSKRQEIAQIQKLYSEGQRHFAENYIQEALDKITQLQELKIHWHLIGPIQKNKVKFLKNHFEYIHSIDSLELAEKISEKALEINYLQKVFLQINLSAETTKSGFDQAKFETAWPKLAQMKGLQVVGLMTMPPLENAPEKNRKYFKELKKMGQSLNLNEFSMGTSHDYKVALEEGATWIRLGTILFGERIKK